MWALWLVSALGLGVAVWALLGTARHMENPRAHRRLVLGTGAAAALFLIGPPLVRSVAADWRSALGTVAALGAAGLALWAYVRLVRSAHARARKDEEE